jgi:hypothetical protein
MQTGFIFGIIGAVLLMLGVFVPLVSFPVFGGVNLFQIQQPVAVGLLALAGLHLVFCINRVAWGLYVTKLGILAAIGFGIYRSWDRITGPSNLLTSIIKPMVKVHWGTGLLAAGILIVMAAAIPRSKVKDERPTETLALKPESGELRSATEDSNPESTLD